MGRWRRGWRRRRFAIVWSGSVPRARLCLFGGTKRFSFKPKSAWRAADRQGRELGAASTPRLPVIRGPAPPGVADFDRRQAAWRDQRPAGASRHSSSPSLRQRFKPRPAHVRRLRGEFGIFGNVGRIDQRPGQRSADPWAQSPSRNWARWQSRAGVGACAAGRGIGQSMPGRSRAAASNAASNGPQAQCRGRGSAGPAVPEMFMAAAMGFAVRPMGGEGQPRVDIPEALAGSRRPARRSGGARQMLDTLRAPCRLARQEQSIRSCRGHGPW
jgi:hypothetical protein